MYLDFFDLSDILSFESLVVFTILGSIPISGKNFLKFAEQFPAVISFISHVAHKGSFRIYRKGINSSGLVLRKMPNVLIKVKIGRKSSHIR